MRPVKRALKMLESPEEDMSEKDQVQQTRQVRRSDQFGSSSFVQRLALLFVQFLFVLRVALSASFSYS